MTAQFYFNNTYNNTSYYSELSSHITVLEDGTYLVPTVSTNANGFHYNWRYITENGVEVSQLTLFDSSAYLYPGQNDCFVRTFNGSYLQSQIIGFGGLMKYSSDGELIWNLEVDSLSGGTSFLELNDGELFLCMKEASDSSFTFTQLTAQGEPLRSVEMTPIDSSQFTVLEETKELPEKSILLGGWALFFRNTFTTDRDEVMLRIDSLGNILWTKIWDDDTTDQIAFFCDGDNDSTVVMPIKQVEWYQDNDNHQPFTAFVGTALVNVNTGDTSAVYFTDLLLDNPLVWEILRTPDQGYCMMGSANDEEHLFTFLMKLDVNRELEWFKKYSPEPPDEASYYVQSWDMEVAADSGFVVCGEALEFIDGGGGKQMPWIFKTDQCGELEWNNCGADNTHEFNDSNIQRFKIAPNPVSDVVSISSEQPIQSIIVRDITGKIVLVAAQLSGLQAQVNVSTLAKGLYLVEVDFGGGVIGAQKLVVE